MKPKIGSSRREFLGAALAGVAGAGALGFKRLRASTPTPSPAPGKLITRALGKTGFRVPVVSMGVMNADLPALIKRACELGITHFDTAAGYARGRNEEMVGQVLREVGLRNKSVIATKIMNPGARRNLTVEQAKSKILEMVEASLKRLGTDRVEILYIHDISDPKDVSDAGLLEGLSAAKKQGKALAVGFSTHKGMDVCLAEAMKTGVHDVVLTAYNYSLAPYPEILQAMDKAAASGIGLVAMKTQCQQDWYREGLPSELQAYYRGTIVHSALLKWVLNHACFTTAVPGVTSFNQIEEDAACALDLSYTPAEKKFLEDRKIKLALLSACRQCGACQATCPRGADVPGLMRAHMYAFSYGNPLQAREMLDTPSVRRSLEACGDCGTCRAACSGRVSIARRIEALKQAFA